MKKQQKLTCLNTIMAGREETKRETERGKGERQRVGDSHQTVALSVHYPLYISLHATNVGRYEGGELSGEDGVHGCHVCFSDCPYHISIAVYLVTLGQTFNLHFPLIGLHTRFAFPLRLINLIRNMFWHKESHCHFRCVCLCVIALTAVNAVQAEDN